MGQTQEKPLESIILQMQAQKAIQRCQAERFLQDYLASTDKVKDVKSFLNEENLTLFLKHFINSTYDQNSRNRQSSTTKRSRDEIKENLQFVLCREIRRFISTKTDSFQSKFEQTCQKLCDSAINNRVHKIKPYTDTILSNLFNIEKFYSLTQLPDNQIQFYNSKIDFIKNISKLDSIYKNFCEFIEQQKQTLDKQNRKHRFLNLSNEQHFATNFGIDKMDLDKCIGIVIVQQQEVIAILIEFKNQVEEYFESLNQDGKSEDLKQLCKTMIGLAMLPTCDRNSKQKIAIFMKKALEIFSIFSTIQQQNMQKKLKNFASRWSNTDFKAQSQTKKTLINIIKQILCKPILSQAVRDGLNKLLPEIIKFENLYKQVVHQIGLYSSAIQDQNTMLFDFDKYGELQFYYSHFDNQVSVRAANLWAKDQKKIADIFQSYKGLQSALNKVYMGQEKGVTIKQKDNDIEIELKTKENGILDRICITITKKVGTMKNINNEQISQVDTLQQESMKNIQASKDIKDNQILISKLEEQNPGIMQQGWIGMFIKGNEHAKQRNAKKHYTQLRRGSTAGRSNNSKNFTSIEGVNLLLKDIRVENEDINFLNFEAEKLELFVTKLFWKLEYFKNLPNMKEQFENFLTQIHLNYEIHKNHFHNFVHGVNVMHTCYLLATVPKSKVTLTSMQIFSIVFSGLCHDVGHTGFTNAFQIASRSPKALLYNDQSPLQNFHASLTFQILRKPGNNFLLHLKQEQFTQFRKNVISNILYTDIKQHFPLLKKFQTRMQKNYNQLDKEDASILSAMIVHSSDFGHNIKNFSINREWAERVNLQFTNQFKMEGQLGLPQTPFMKDLDKLEVLSKNQGGFLKVIVLPLYQALNNYCQNSVRIKSMLVNLQNNIENWNKLHQEALENLKQQNKQNNQQQMIGN